MRRGVRADDGLWVRTDAGRSGCAWLSEPGYEEMEDQQSCEIGEAGKAEDKHGVK
ncbi:MAG: hypothetical protein JWQ42_2665 [Edaphobacter sp.]|nr:hypothetical protein [Edaphobacter sp.]